MGEEEGNTCTCMYWERRNKWLPVFLLLVPPPTHTCRYTYVHVHGVSLLPVPPPSPLPSHSTLYPSPLLFFVIFSLPPPSPPPPNVCIRRANTDRRRLCYTCQAEGLLFPMWLPHGGALQAERVREEGGREGAEGSGLMGEQKGYTCTCMYWERRKKWLPVFLLLVPPPTHTCRYMYMYMVYLFFLFPHPPLYHLILPYIHCSNDQ